MILNASSNNDTKTRCVLLWENPSTSTFESCDIDLTLSGYKIIYVLFRRNTDAAARYGAYFLNDIYLEQQLTVFDENYVYARIVTMTIDNIHFSKGIEYTFGNDLSQSAVTNNDVIIPFRIYGLY